MPSVTTTVTPRAAVFGEAAAFAYVTLRNAVSYCATVAEPVSVSTPVVALKPPVMPFCAANASASCAEMKLVAIATVAPVRVGLSTSLTVRPLSTATAPSPAV